MLIICMLQTFIKYEINNRKKKQINIQPNIHMDKTHPHTECAQPLQDPETNT